MTATWTEPSFVLLVLEIQLSTEFIRKEFPVFFHLIYIFEIESIIIDGVSHDIV